MNITAAMKMIHETHETHEKKIKNLCNLCNLWASFFSLSQGEDAHHHKELPEE